MSMDLLDLILTRSATLAKSIMLLISLLHSIRVSLRVFPMNKIYPLPWFYEFIHYHSSTNLSLNSQCIHNIINSLPDTTVTGPCTLASRCLVKFLTIHCSKVDLPTFGGPTMAITIGGGSRGVLSTKGMCCFLVLISCVLKENYKRTIFYFCCN